MRYNIPCAGSSAMNQHRLELEFRTLALRCKDEDAVVDELATFAEVLEFDSCRYYDVHRCPFRRTTFAVLRKWTGEYPEPPRIGTEIFDTTYDNQALQPEEVYFESAVSGAALDPKKCDWIARFGLSESGWYDVPVVDGDEIIGLWALSRRGLATASEGQKLLLFGIATVAGGRIAHLRDKEARNAARSIKGLGSREGLADLLQDGLSSIATALDAAFVAFYRFEPQDQRLVRLLEIYHDGTTGACVPFVSPADEAYRIDQYLTGQAWTKEETHFIPSFLSYRTTIGKNINLGSVVNHETRQGAALASVLFYPLQSSGGVSGMLRVINRCSKPSLLFGSHHARLLEQLALPLFHALGSVQTSERFEMLWEGFQKIYAHVRDSGLAFRELSSITGKLHVRETVVSIWAESGGLLEAWRWSNGNVAQRISVSASLDISATAIPEGYESAGSLPRAFASLLPDHSDFVLVVPYRDYRQDIGRAPLVLTVFVLTEKSPSEAKTSGQRLRDYWKGDVHAKKTLELIGRMLGVVHELSRNRSLLRLAEEAIGTIGHEARSPLSELTGIHSDLFDVTDSILRSARDIEPLDVTVLNLRGDINDLTQILTKDQATQWLRDAKSRLSSSSNRIGRVVGDAIRWARLGGNSIEADFSTVDVLSLVRQARRELRQEFLSRQWLHLTMAPGVFRAPSFVGDPVLLQVLFTNLIDNAVKYSHQRDPHDRRGIRSEVRVIAEVQKNVIDVSFENWGLGIAENDYENIFSSFYRSATRDVVHTIRGVGLGLPTCKKIALVHGGDIRVSSKPTLADAGKNEAMLGYETIFTVRLPLDLQPGRRDVNVARMSDNAWRRK
jgi:signal transduction histidine kinase